MTNNEKGPPKASPSQFSYDDEGGFTPRPHAPFEIVSTHIQRTGQWPVPRSGAAR